MNREEILAKSRKEHQNNDPYEKETSQCAGIGGTIAAVCVCFILMCLEIFIGEGNPVGFQAIMMATLSGEFLARSIRSKRVFDVVAAILFGLMAIYLVILYIIKLIG